MEGARIWQAVLTGVAIASAGGAIAVATGGSGAGTAGADAATAATLPPAPATVAAGPIGTASRPALGTTASRYSLVGGCFTLVRSATGAPIAAAAGPFRMQASALGEYLLLGRAGGVLTDAGTGATDPVPGPAAVWRVEGSRTAGYTVTNTQSGATLPVRFVAASGCATFPEAGVGASGTPAAGPSPEATVDGTVEGHAHITGFELFGGDWHCGRPFSPYGVTAALPYSCADKQVGANGLFQSFLDFGGVNRPSDFHGWPLFHGWPSPTALAEESDYWTGLERAWKGGMRLLVNNLVDNEALCDLMTVRHNPCDDMASVRIQSRDLYALQDYIDAQSGGPGQGFFRIVTDPFAARRVINAGRLAVIEGIEVSRIFGCGEHGGVPECDLAHIDAGLKEIERLGVRTFFPVHEFDNAFGGSKMIAGETGAVVNAGNRVKTGSFFTVAPCPADQQDAPQVTFGTTGVLAQLANGPLGAPLGGAALPVYPPGPHCNVRGLTDLGAALIRRMAARHQLIQLDHMDSKTADATVAIAEQLHYAGVVSAHCCNSPQLFRRMYRIGGFVNPAVMGTGSFLATYGSDHALLDRRFRFGFGWGSDMNGLGGQPGPDSVPHVSYPFTSHDGRVTFTRQTWGQRTWDLNTDGLAHYGLYADWLHGITTRGGAAFTRAMFSGAESYLETWERAVGVPAGRCRSSRGNLGAAGTRSLPLGTSSTRLLFALGQPSARPGGRYVYCVDGTRAPLTARIDRSGRVVAYETGARGYAAGGVRPGDPVRALRARARPVSGRGGSVWMGRRLRGSARFVYGVVRGRVAEVAVALPGAWLVTVSSVAP